MSVIELNAVTGAERILARCKILAGISSMPGAICRTYLTPEHSRANEQVHKWMSMAGMTTWEDAVGNCWGRYRAEEDDAPTLILGSHLDTVPNAGAYDGILGVLTAIELVDALFQASERLPFHIDIVGFGDEEGVRYGATLLGSCAVAGRWKEEWMTLVDQSGISLRDALHQFHGHELDPHSASRQGESFLGYLELHIEQGPVLEEAKLPVGVVTAIAGARRFEIELKGMAGHAGTVPMAMRRDALCAASEMILSVEQIAQRYSVVATVGKVQAAPGSVNVIPGHCSFTVDIRSGQDSTRDHAWKEIEQQCRAIAKKRDIAITLHEFHNAPAVQCASEFQRRLETAISGQGIAPLSLLSGAGHDAMAMAALTEVGMLFVRCEKGISHHPAEAVTEADVAAGLAVFEQAVRSFI